MNYDVKQGGERIRQLRKKNGYTQEQIARFLNIDRSHYSRIESGKNGCSVDLFVPLSELFGVSLDYLILGRSDLTPAEKAEQASLKEAVRNLITHLEQFNAGL